MPVSKIKNLILLILALSVVCLLFLAVPMRTAQIQAEEALHAQLEELFASYDIQLDRGILPRSVDLYTVELSGQQADNAAAAAALLGADVPQTVEEKRAFLLANHIALWDVIASCDIAGSSDASIRNAVPNDLTPILETASIRQIFTNGGTAHRLYRKYIYPLTGREDIVLPSTSPANAARSLDALVDAWQIVREALEAD